MDKQLLDAIIEKIEIKTDSVLRFKNAKDAPYVGSGNHPFILEAEPISYFVKTNVGKPKDFFEKEADGLHVLSIASMRHMLVPKPMFWGEIGNTQFLVMEYITMTEPTTDFFEKLGIGMAHVHKNTNHFYGLQEDNYVGSDVQINGKYENWANFYTKSRVFPQMRKAFDNQRITSDDVKRIENLCNQLPSLLPQEKPALLHGDFWIGNVSATSSGMPSIFDPSSYYGFREMDIAMSLLMGGFDESFYTAYNSAFPLQKGWQNRIGINQVYPLLVLLNNFSDSYYNRLKEVIGKY
ncbi:MULTISPECIES: fructosamine kinase family protein [Chitinophagaceae]